VTVEGAIGWVWRNAETTAVVFLVLAGAGLLVRVGYLVALALADLRLRWRGGDAAGQLADWLSGGRGGPGGHSLLYTTYLQSDAWRARRERTLLLAGGVCQRCGRERATDAHHKHYRTLGRERDGDLEALCPACHAQLHGRSRVA
jgi:HNH endonuclease